MLIQVNFKSSKCAGMKWHSVSAQYSHENDLALVRRGQQSDEALRHQANPRLLVDRPFIDKFLAMVDIPYNCLALCSGSLNANAGNNVAEIVHKHADRIAFARVRNVKHFENGDFSESSHRDCEGDTGILDILKAYHDAGWNGYIRPDNGRHLWGEGAGTVRPVYGIYDRALGIMYALGVWDSLEKFSQK